MPPGLPVLGVVTPQMPCMRSCSNAGHLPPLLVAGRTRATYLEGGRSAAVGLGGPGGQETVEVTADTRLVLYTDGLIERRGQPLDDTLDQLAATAAALPAADAQTWCDTLLAARTKDDTLTDDIAVACIDLNGPGQPVRP